MIKHNKTGHVRGHNQLDFWLLFVRNIIHYSSTHLVKQHLGTCVSIVKGCDDIVVDDFTLRVECLLPTFILPLYTMLFGT